MLRPEEFVHNLHLVRQLVTRAAERAGRDPNSVEIMAVSKTFPEAYVQIARNEGIHLFGENRVQEAIEKFSGPINPGLDLRLDLIGHLQRNKARKAAQLFFCVQSIDKIETAQALERACRELDKKIDILFEVNTADEESKFGFRNDDALNSCLETVLTLPHLRLRGLMTVGPFTDDENRIRSAFRSLKQSFEGLIQQYPELHLDTLSMGMSHDFEIAVEEGASMLRLGTALFGRRG